MTRSPKTSPTNAEITAITDRLATVERRLQELIDIVEDAVNRQVKIVGRILALEGKPPIASLDQPEPRYYRTNKPFPTCTCGHSMGEHAAEAPHRCADYKVTEGAIPNYENCPCTAFVESKP